MPFLEVLLVWFCKHSGSSPSDRIIITVVCQGAISLRAAGCHVAREWLFLCPKEPTLRRDGRSYKPVGRTLIFCLILVTAAPQTSQSTRHRGDPSGMHRENGAGVSPEAWGCPIVPLISLAAMIVRVHLSYFAIGRFVIVTSANHPGGWRNMKFDAILSIKNEVVFFYQLLLREGDNPFRP